MIRVGAIDPGLKPGAVEVHAVTGALLRASHRLEQWVFETPWDVFATEGQWYYGDNGVNVNNLLTLAFRAGFTLACVPADVSLRLPPKVWRADIGGPQLTKEQVQKKIAKTLTADERKLFSSIPRSRHGDVLDAIGIARCAARLARTPKHPDLKKYAWKLTK